jgi:hypothetical protein
MDRLEEPVHTMAARLTSCCTEAECLAMASRLEQLRDHCMQQSGLHEELVAAIN